jgi:diguanylate cyclase (GGDEF)-like protein
MSACEGMRRDGRPQGSGPAADDEEPRPVRSAARNVVLLHPPSMPPALPAAADRRSTAHPLWMRLRSLQWRIVAVFVLLVLAVQALGFLLISTAGVAGARKTVADELATGERVFLRLMDQSAQRLVQGARVLSGDFAFREAIATGDRETIASVLRNHGDRIDASYMTLIGLDRDVVADTLDRAAEGQRFPYPRLIAQAERDGKAVTMMVVRGGVYQVVVLPVLAPVPIAWVAMGFAVNDTYMQDLRRLTGLEVSFVTQARGAGWSVPTSTLPVPLREHLLPAFARGLPAAEDLAAISAGGEEYVSRVVALPARDDEAVVAVLQQPLEGALASFRRLQHELALFSLVSLGVAGVLSIVLARGIARPVQQLAQVARRIAAGDYSAQTPAPRRDEIGDLAHAFRSMQAGLAARESQIMDLAYRDTLTGLPNRALFSDRLEQALRLAPRMNAPMSVVLMDVDNFKYVNDTLGHQVGDLLLREVAERLSTVVRRESDTVARLGGDEFVVLLPSDDVEGALRVARGLQAALEAPMRLDGHVVDCRVSMGIASYPVHGDSATTLLRRADVAMYTAKRLNNGLAVYDDRHDHDSRARLSLMGELRQAVDQGQLRLHYQPKVHLAKPRELHVEALVRWQHPVRGMVPPSEFIPFAEQTGFVRAITQWVLAEAVRQCAEWRRGGLAAQVWVNISARDLLDPDLAERFAALLAAHGCQAASVGLEITESAILDDPGHALRNLERLSALGCRIAIDDYGTGYSSLAYLKRLPVNELKIDRSFVMGMVAEASDAVIVRSTIDLAHNMGLLVVAEGVEDEATLRRLREMGCDLVQGFHLSKPLPAAEATRWLRASAQPRPAAEVTELRRAV